MDFNTVVLTSGIMMCVAAILGLFVRPTNGCLRSILNIIIYLLVGLALIILFVFFGSR